MVTKGYTGTSLRDILTDFEPTDEVPENPYNPDYDPPFNDYLEPIGNTGFWITPDEPADPLDCRRYPASPWCGGSGIDPQSIVERSPIDITPRFSKNECEVCVEVDVSLFYIALPKNMICYRSKRPECQPPPIEPPPPPPPPPPGGNTGGFTPYNGPRISGCWHRLFLQATHKHGTPPNVNTIVFRTVSSYYFHTTPDGIYNYVASNGLYGYGFATKYTASDRDDAISSVAWSGGASFEPYTILGIEYPEDMDECRSVPPAPPPPSPPPPPPPPPTGCCMSCCKPSDNDDNNELLRLIALRLGAFSYPVQTPKWLVTNQGSASVSHQSLTDFLMWTVMQVDALAGEFPIKVEIEDTDPSKEGNQTKSVSLPNIAECLAEIYGLVAKSAIDGDVHTSFLTRLAVEVMSTKVAALVAQDYASANASFLGYKGNQVARDVQLSFDPEGTESIDAILKGSTMQYKGWRNEDRDSVISYLERLMFSAGIIKAVFFRSKRDVDRVLNDMKSFGVGDGNQQDEDWREFLQRISNPSSDLNRGSSSKPDVDRL